MGSLKLVLPENNRLFIEGWELPIRAETMGTAEGRVLRRLLHPLRLLHWHHPNHLLRWHCPTRGLDLPPLALLGRARPLLLL